MPAARRLRWSGARSLALCACACAAVGCPQSAPPGSTPLGRSVGAGAPEAPAQQAPTAPPQPGEDPAPPATEPPAIEPPATEQPAPEPPATEQPAPEPPAAQTPAAQTPAPPAPPNPLNAPREDRVPPPNPLAGKPAPENPLTRAAAAPDPWAGTWEGEGLRVELRREGQGWAGTIAMGPDAFPVALRPAGPAGERLSGEFKTREHPFPCAFTRQGDDLQLETAGTTYRLHRPRATGRLLGGEAPPQNPLAGAAPQATGPGPKGAAPAVPADWQTFTHPLGMTMRYPAGWQLRELQGFMALVPPDLAMEYGQPAEVLLVGGAGNAGVSGPDDPRVAQYADALVQQLLPFLRREGGAEALPGARPTGLFRWSGQNPQGKAIQARMWVVLFPEHAMLVFLAGEAQRVRQREEPLRLVAGSFQQGEAQRDARLVGAWRYESHYFSGPGGGNFSSTSIRYLTLQADGTAYSGGRLLASATHKDSGGDPYAHSSLDSGDPDQKRGRWSAGNGRLFLQWKDGGEEYKYEQSGRSLLLTPEGGKPKLYERAN